MTPICVSCRRCADAVPLRTASKNRGYCDACVSIVKPANSSEKERGAA